MIKIAVATLLFYSTVLIGNGIKEKTESIIRSEFGENVDVSFQKFIIPEEIKKEIELEAKQRFYSKSVIVWRISCDDSLLAIGLMDNVYGKAQPITFLTIFSMNGNISSNYIVKYREQYGGQVADARWNKQFFEMNEESNFLKIDGISGATISVNSIKKGVMKLSLLIKTILNSFQ